MKNIIVSGANGNLGKAVVQHYLENNYNVIGLVHRKKENNKKKNYQEIAVNLTDEEKTAKIIKKIMAKQPEIHTAVLTAGGFATGKLKNTTGKDLDKQYNLNFKTAYHTVRAIINNDRKNTFKNVFFIGSEPGMDTSQGKGVLAYTLAKSQLFQLANIINASYYTTKAFVIVPSTIDTPENRKAVPDADFSKWEKPEKIAQIIGKYSTKKEASSATLIVSKELKKL